jgi:ATP/maltotriose-dependent transcriptional regulator MalT
MIAVTVHEAAGVDPRSKAREALEAHDWATAFDLLTKLSETSAQSADDAYALGQAAWWLGRMDVSMDAHQRAHQQFVASGRTDPAVMTAVYLSYSHANKGDFAMAAAWHARAARLAHKFPESPAAGYLGIVECGTAYHSGDLEGCLARAQLVTKIGEDRTDPTLVAWGLHWQGLALIRQGHIDQGWTLVDEAMLDITLRQMEPLWAGFLHCNTIRLCDELGDPGRGWRWVEVTERWLEKGPTGPLYSGICRMFKASILRERGIWPEAEREARRVCDELATLHISSESRAYYELGELKRLGGDFAGAEAFFRQAQEMAFDPQPGLARLRLAQGHIDVASDQIRRALGEAGDRLARARLLPDLAAIALARGDFESARSAIDELDGTATAYRSPGLAASAASARAAVLLAQPDPASALATFRMAARLSTDLGSPYRVAVARRGAGEALRALGDEDSARIELDAARAIFDRLGAGPDADQTASLLGRRPHPAGLSDREVEVLRHVAAGRSNKEIAAELDLSEHTVARHMSNIFAKIAVSSRASAVAYALRHGIA